MKKENIFQHETAEESVGFLMWKVHNHWQRSIRQQLKVHDLTHTQFVVLAGAYYLAMQHDEITQVLIADHAGIDVMLTSNVIRALEKKNYLRRVAHSHDTRAKAVQVTEQGTAVLKIAVKDVESFDAAYFSALRDRPAFIKELLSLSQQIDNHNGKSK